MTTAQVSRITPPPSVEAVLGALTEETRIGQVDFSSRLTDPTEGDAAADEPTPALIADTEADEIETETAAEELADAPAGDGEESAYDDDHTAEIHTLLVPAPPVASVAPVASVTATEPASKKTKRRLSKKSAPAPAVPAETARVEPAADAPALEPEAIEAPVQEAAELDEPEVTVRRQRPLLPEPLDMAALLDSSEGVDERPPSIEEIARLVVERMHDAELAMMRHLEAVEVETARRAELATAQAELDAELIRLHARREAHAIITEARLRAGQDVEVDDDQVELEKVTDSLTRFADVLDELRPSPGRRT